MVRAGRSLITSRFTGTEFQSNSALNEGVSIEDLDLEMGKSARRGVVRRKRSQSKARRFVKY